MDIPGFKLHRKDRALTNDKQGRGIVDITLSQPRYKHHSPQLIADQKFSVPQKHRANFYKGID